MPVKMIADRRHYHKEKGVEYEKGAEFTVDSEQEADRLVRLRRASRSGGKPVKAPEPVAAPAPVFRTTEMKAEETLAEDPAPRRRYQRRDLRPEE